MENTEKITVNELANRMRKMEVGTAIDLLGGVSGDQWHGIRRLPDDMFDNGKCWIADYYGGGCAKCFCESELDDYVFMTDELQDWLYENDLLQTDDTVNVEIKDETEAQTKWEFKRITIEPENQFVKVGFSLYHEYETNIVIPKKADEEEITQLVRDAIYECKREAFAQSVTDMEATDWDPDIAGIVVYDRGKLTNLPVGTMKQ